MNTAFPSIDKARAYVEKMPGAISGVGGHDATFAVACKLVEFGDVYKRQRLLCVTGT